MNLSDYARSRDAVLERIVEILSADPRVEAVWLSGSFGRDVADAWSDLDLHLSIADAGFTAFLTERDRLYRRVGLPLLVQHDMPSTAQPGSRYQLVLYPGPIGVDWNIGPASQAVRPRETLILFSRRDVPVAIPPPLPADERRTRASDSLVFFWAMAPIAVKYAARGDSRLATRQIDLLTGAFIFLWRVVMLPDGPDPSAPAHNQAAEPDLDALLPRLEWDIDPLRALAVIRELCAEVERLHPSLASIGVPIPTRMPAETAALADLAEETIRQGRPPGRRTYR